MVNKIKKTGFCSRFHHYSGHVTPFVTRPFAFMGNPHHEGFGQTPPSSHSPWPLARGDGRRTPDDGAARGSSGCAVCLEIDIVVGTPEMRLPGGRLTTVMRAGDTVRRPAQPWSSEVQRLLGHLRQRGFLLAPEPLGVDGEGRDVVRYIEGDTSATVTPWPGALWSDELLVAAGKTVAAYHRAVRDFTPSPSAHWQFRPRPLRQGEIICHHDFAPYNAVFRGTTMLGMIDWECAGPGTITEELAFLAWQWVPLGFREREVDIGSVRDVDPVARLRLLLDSYGHDDRAGFIDAVMERVETSRAGIEERARAGDAAFVSLQRDGYTRDMQSLLSDLAMRRKNLQAAIE